MQIRIPSSAYGLGLLLFAAQACATSGSSSYEAMRHDYAALQTRARSARTQDDRALTTSPLDRAALIRAVLDRNPTLEASRQAWRAALARYRQAGAYEDPMIELSAAPLSFASSDARVGYEVGISQRIPLGGKRDAAATLAIAQAEAASTDYDAARLQLALTASQLYDEYFIALRSAEINARHVEFMHTLKQSAVVGYQTGHGAVQDSLSADAELAQLEYEAVVLETQRKVAVAQLNALLHRDPNASLPAPPAELPAPVDAGGHDSGGTAHVLEQRPDIAAARARVRVEDARSQVAEQDAYPDLTLSTSYNSMWDMPEHRWMAGVALNIPLERERRNGAVEEAQAMRAAAQSEVQRMSDDARSEIAIAELRVAEAKEALRLHEQRLLPVARQQVDAAQAGFISSQGSFSMVVDAARNLRSLELGLQVLRAELSKRVAELDRAQGRIPGLSDSEARP